LTEEFNVGVVGAGYVGLVTGACLAHVGHRVVCADRDEGRVAELREGRMPIYEPDLEELVADGARRGRLSFSTDLPEVLGGADVVFIAVDTPQGEDGSADLSSVGAVARSIGRALLRGARGASGRLRLDGGRRLRRPARVPCPRGSPPVPDLALRRLQARRGALPALLPDPVRPLVRGAAPTSTAPTRTPTARPGSWRSSART
jgi:UDP-glucose/GDP-mannose dehydrogenase family protein